VLIRTRKGATVKIRDRRHVPSETQAGLRDIGEERSSHSIKTGQMRWLDQVMDECGEGNSCPSHAGGSTGVDMGRRCLAESYSLDWNQPPEPRVISIVASVVAHHIGQKGPPVSNSSKIRHSALNRQPQNPTATENNGCNGQRLKKCNATHHKW
jgi:hypothetical protein